MLQEAVYDNLSKNNLDSGFDSLSGQMKALFDKFVNEFRVLVEKTKAAFVQNPQHVVEPETEVSLKEILEVVLAWTRMHSRLFERDSKSTAYLLKKFALSDGFSSAIIDILSLSTDFKATNQESTIYIPVGSDLKYDEYLILTKTEALICTANLMRSIYS